MIYSIFHHLHQNAFKSFTPSQLIYFPIKKKKKTNIFIGLG